MPAGPLVGGLAFGALVVLTLVAPRRPRWLAGLAFRVSAAYNEAPFLFILVIIAGSIGPAIGGQFESTGGLAVLGLTLLVVFGLLVIARRGARERPLVERALDDGLGAGWRDSVDSRLLEGIRTRPPLGWILFMPFVFRPPGVASTRNVAYGPAGRLNLLDIHRPRRRTTGAPVLLFFHGGGYRGGRKGVEARELLFRLASRGWVTVSADYRLRPRADFFDHLADAKRAIGWIHDHIDEYGGDASMLFLSGGSAGGHLATIAGLTQNEPRYQPGFEDASSSVTAVAPLYGWYGGYYELGDATSEGGVLGHPADDAPPFFIAHGTEDSAAPIETARRFAAHLRETSPNPVVFTELPHGQHAFALFHSFRFSAVVDGIEAFASWVRTHSDRGGGSNATRRHDQPP